MWHGRWLTEQYLYLLNNTNSYGTILTLPAARLPMYVARPLVTEMKRAGGVSAEEREHLRAMGVHAVRLGPTVLRTSTAGAVGAAVVASRTPRWGGAGGCESPVSG